jgi:hypothetical protein
MTLVDQPVRKSVGIFLREQNFQAFIEIKTIADSFDILRALRA